MKKSAACLLRGKAHLFVVLISKLVLKKVAWEGGATHQGLSTSLGGRAVGTMCSEWFTLIHDCCGCFLPLCCYLSHCPMATPLRLP